MKLWQSIVPQGGVISELESSRKVRASAVPNGFTGVSKIPIN